LLPSACFCLLPLCVFVAMAQSKICVCIHCISLLLCMMHVCMHACMYVSADVCMSVSCVHGRMCDVCIRGLMRNMGVCDAFIRAFTCKWRMYVCIHACGIMYVNFLRLCTWAYV
jgi:hypothetical protein